MKSLIISLSLILSISTFARPNGPRPGLGNRPPSRGPVPHQVAPRPHNNWGHGGRDFWPGFVGGVVGGVVGTTIVNPPVVPLAPVVVTPTPVVVSSPVVIPPQPPRKVWVEGRYIDQIQPNGTILRVWQAGHWEYK